jgi:dienelactone hydrolase
VEHIDPIPFPHAIEPSDQDLENALAEVDAAIALVGRGAAVRIRLIGFALAGAVAGLAAAHAQLAGVGFQLDRPGVAGAVAIIVGPLL